MSVSFDRIAPYYDRLAYTAFFGTLQRAQRRFLSKIPSHARLLFLGGGSGFLLPDLFRLEKISHITYVEASAVMLSRAKKTVRQYQQAQKTALLPPLTFVHGSEEDIPEDNTYQVVITNFVLDMYTDTEVSGLMRGINTRLSADALWLFTDFRASRRWGHRLWQVPLLRLMFWFFRQTTGLSTRQLPDYAYHFQTLGWYTEQECTFFGDFIVSRVYRPTSSLRPGVVPSGT